MDQYNGVTNLENMSGFGQLNDISLLVYVYSLYALVAWS